MISNNLITISEWMKKYKSLNQIKISGDYKHFINHLKSFLNEITTRKSKGGQKPDIFQKESVQRNDLKDDLLRYILDFSKNETKPLNENDLSIRDINGNVRVIIEYKRSIRDDNDTRLSSNPDMMHLNNLNCKAFQELVSYYLREKTGLYKDKLRKPRDKEEIIGIVTDGLEWFIFSEKTLNKYFLTKYLVDIYRTWCSYSPKTNYQISLFNDNRPSLFTTNENKLTKDLYAKISYFINKALSSNIKIGYINISQLIQNSTVKLPHKKFHGKLISFYRFLSQQCLLDQDKHIPSNKLNYKFYNELLYIMGLQDLRSQKGISLIPKSSKNYSNGSLIQLVYSQMGEFSYHSKKVHFGDAVNITMSLVDRLIFLKLLEGQLISIHSSKRFRFITTNNIKNFTDLSYLFFNVMNKRKRDLHDSHYSEYRDVPYLNSSLFVHTNTEKKYNFETDKLDSQRKLKLFNKTTLKKNEIKNYQNILPNTLIYLITFLNDYTFRANKVSLNKRIINASILGMIFEKINGYKDGSYYTPTVITNYIAKHTINGYLLSLVNNEIKGNKHHFTSIKDLYKHSYKYSNIITKVLNNIKILDPAVGSGHFLVSALNYLLYLKNYFDIISFYSYELKFRDGNLILINGENNNNFSYEPFSKKSKDIQSTLFNEKKYIIEHNLYGVDINLNSVNITKLRLWVELLKNAYYKSINNNHLTKMSTMPNLEMNIKVGNSLTTHIIKNDHMNILKNNYMNLPLNRINVSITNLKERIKSYRNSSYKGQIKRHELISYQMIQDAISRLSICFDLRLISKKYGQTTLFKNVKIQKINNLLRIVKKSSKTLFNNPIPNNSNLLKFDEQEINKIKRLSRKLIGYNTFEWPLEFPDLIDMRNNKLIFNKFDVIITNPPYIKYSDKDFINFINSEYNHNFTMYQIKSFMLFINLGLHLTNSTGFISMIIPNPFLTNNQYENGRHYLLRHKSHLSIMNSHDHIFSSAAVDNCIISFQNSKSKDYKKEYVKGYSLNNGKINYFGHVLASDLVNQDIINVDSFKDYKHIYSILKSMKQNGSPIILQNRNKFTGRYKLIKENYGYVKTGAELYEKNKGIPKQPAKLGQKNPYVKVLSKHTPIFNKKFLGKRNIYRYKLTWPNTYVDYGKNLANSRKEAIFKGPRILIGQTLNNSRNDFPYILRATYAKHEYICSKNVFIIHPTHIEPLIMLAVLNSKLLNFFIIEKLGLVQRNTFPQIRNYNIRDLPIPLDLAKNKITKKRKNNLINDVKIIMRTDKHSETKYRQANKDINNIIMDAFQLNKNQKNFINSFN